MTFRQRKTHYPRTFILYRNKHRYYILCWLEYDFDGSIYLWFDDDPNNSWELVSVHSFKEIKGKITLKLQRKTYKLFDPHISWHKSGIVHVRGYNHVGEKRQNIITNKKAHSLIDVRNGQTVPFSQIIFPTVNYKKALKFLSKSMPETIKNNKYFGILDKKGFRLFNDKSLDEAYIIIDDKLIPKSSNLGIDFCIHDKAIEVNPPGNFGNDLLSPFTISLSKAKTQNSVGIRVFASKVEFNNKEVKSIIATCFNQETYDLIELKKL